MCKDLFDNQIENKPWQEEWQDMPEFISEDEKEYQKIIVRFACEKDVEEFSKRINQKIYPTTQSIWFPKLKQMSYIKKAYVNET